MSLVLKKNESHAAMLIKSTKKDQATTKPGKA